MLRESSMAGSGALDDDMGVSATVLLSTTLALEVAGPR